LDRHRSPTVNIQAQRMVSGDLTTSVPFDVIVPSLSLVIVAILRIKVDLSAPLGPSNPEMPGLISREDLFNPAILKFVC
jgi:hypothetical protein